MLLELIIWSDYSVPSFRFVRSYWLVYWILTYIYVDVDELKLLVDVKLKGKKSYNIPNEDVESAAKAVAATPANKANFLNCIFDMCLCLWKK